jgi:cobalt/nickel transport system permease protein
MHMADALISPAVGGSLWVAAAGLLAYCSRKIKAAMHDSLVPMMGILGAFVFTAQMINFTIPATGSSGHIGGGMLLAILLGPAPAFLVIASVLTVQALFFADGGLLALGCNIINLGLWPAFVAYPFIYQTIARGETGTPRASWATVLACVAGLQLGAFSVVLETRLSGISDLPFGTFVLLMQPIHLAIGIVEGLATAAVVSFVARARPSGLPVVAATNGFAAPKPAMIGLVVGALALGCVGSWFASSHPDGLEWSIAKVTGHEEVAGSETSLHERMAQIQEKTAFLPDYGFAAPADQEEAAPAEAEAWPAVSAGTSVSGFVGGALTLAVAGLVGWWLRRRAVSAAVPTA